MFRLEARRPIVRPRPPPFMMGLFGTRSRHRAGRSCSFDLKFANREGGGHSASLCPEYHPLKLIQGPPLSILWSARRPKNRILVCSSFSVCSSRWHAPDGEPRTGDGRPSREWTGVGCYISTTGHERCSLARRKCGFCAGRHGPTEHAASASGSRGGRPERGQNNGLCSAPQACLVLALGYPPVGVPASGVIGNVRAVSLRGRGRCRGGEVR
jgi:hypothetical protein